MALEARGGHSARDWHKISKTCLKDNKQCKSDTDGHTKRQTKKIKRQREASRDTTQTERDRRFSERQTDAERQRPDRAAHCVRVVACVCRRNKIKSKKKEEIRRKARNDRRQTKNREKKMARRLTRYGQIGHGETRNAALRRECEVRWCGGQVGSRGLSSE